MKHKLIIASFGSGSTYFQRSATFWIRELINNQITNPHELLNGIAFKDDYLIKQWTKVTDQSFKTITNLIQSSQRPILARLSYDHLLLRNDSPEDLENFYLFLNDNFDIYTCYRDDLLDYGLCWAIRRCTDREEQFQINCVHSPEDRARLYPEDAKFVINPELVVEQAEKYLKYKSWAQKTFPNSLPVHYDTIESNIDSLLEKYFPASQTIKQKYGISIHEYCRYKYDLSIALQSKNDLQHSSDFINAITNIDSVLDYMCKEKILLDSIPVKSTTTEDKMLKISNYKDTKQYFDQWIKDNQQLGN